MFVQLLACSLLVASLPVSRRSLLAVAGSTGIRPPLQPVSPWLGPAEATLAGSSVFWVRPGSQPSSPSLVKYEPQMALDVLSAAPSRGGALFVGEHHDSASDHAALITSLRQQRGAVPLAVGLEAELGRERLARYIPDAAGFADFSTTQLFRSYVDHAAMGAATAAWVRDNPGGLAISLVGNGHASFGSL
ncbi:hypothetical protein EMIHUDRAFT_206258 [Emiliania huxleyi CCMP1516]|uniref:Haem-binding uptake Tiki superfamily ChaN domain-containing protein n=2 Tax=Emiliania huxleyi TaxID=2903 RepID=A0A0D3JNQ2_EMIH1|nr:hypothetical protein EMIHUDRAFT_206258 [Emiliania huxleyi CCMP1516]EOD25137.1 hypothetical protein EMIHUDRAFT_206258 [Emiliania huxleyi CCMP1516]|eukprot:XP_005777566.1 hypothetical protein EMIHUDRAFT_206258 [Emiliania huxleyi CCMP1516]